MHLHAGIIVQSGILKIGQEKDLTINLNHIMKFWRGFI